MTTESQAGCALGSQVFSGLATARLTTPAFLIDNTMDYREATRADLVKELWLRERNSGALVWVTASGEKVPVKDMTDTHLKNAIRKISEIEELDGLAAEFDAFVSTRW